MNQHQITMTRGDTRIFTVTMTDDAGDPYDLTSADVAFTVGGLFEKGVGDGITIADPETGVAVVTVDPADTNGAPDVRRAYRYDVQVTLSSGAVKTPLRGLFVVVPDVTIPD